MARRIWASQPDTAPPEPRPKDREDAATVREPVVMLSPPEKVSG
jgi:hypothetical protein